VERAINIACTQLTYDEQYIQILVADAITDEVESAFAVHSGRIDLITDDGLHRSSDIVLSFVRYSPKLAEGGIFAVEDPHGSF